MPSDRPQWPQRGKLVRDLEWLNLKHRWDAATELEEFTTEPTGPDWKSEFSYFPNYKLGNRRTRH